MLPEPAEFLVEMTEASDNEILVMKVRNLAERLGFGRTDQFLMATAASELGTNIIRYAGSGAVVVRAVENASGPGIEITASDRGAGIPDVQRAMAEGFSTIPGSLGMGLPTVRRLADEFHIESETGKGVRIRALFWMKHAADRNTPDPA